VSKKEFYSLITRALYTREQAFSSMVPVEAFYTQFVLKKANATKLHGITEEA